MSTLPFGIYLEKEKKFEFDFVTHLLKISFFKESKLANTIVSPFRMIKNDDKMFLLIHDYDRTGERKIMIESIDQDELVISHDNTSYKLQKIRTN
ncbi:hypothetical protein BEL04_03740 [Mucilaginibacter sp. PPCGB 2223]|uniref:hypothetical protein n=1 Tax=Mucilaginibacter sp. PPCGB 2223 TaxID=1886027 RepID=UPI0008241E96|nr:hypothetical protein [Mucilaginibacter sp. PPCGB 2223]OCX53423.1 hypothetical protein BEL04_03740 [Mucilaginibacter sp. PPCGB 2223]